MTNALLRLAALCVFLCAPVGVLAQELTQGTGPICDSEAQIRKLAETSDIHAINAESKDACGMVTVAYIVGPKHGQVRNKDGAFEVTEILIVGVNLGQGWQKLAQPFVQFTLLPIRELGV